MKTDYPSIADVLNLSSNMRPKEAMIALNSM